MQLQLEGVPLSLVLGIERSLWKRDGQCVDARGMERGLRGSGQKEADVAVVGLVLIRM